ncbi:peptidoglycan/LPS O-acetylase OafA/YrhL [Nitrobacter vulgaris]|nr:peptidoglycan/LPS O-acetylase OafA/YrhL [Nitrobacter vulgaris]
MVLFWHFAGQTALSNSAPIAQHISSILIFGRTGVDLFFVLSGFLIIGILIDQRQSRNLFHVFYVRRACRILPPYLLLMALFWIAQSELPLGIRDTQTVPFWSFFLFLQNWFMSFANDWGPPAISVTWSVAIEEQFYLMFPIVLLFTPCERLRAVLLSIAGLSAVSRAILSLADPTANFAPYVNTFFRLDALCIGGFVATVCRDKELLHSLAARRATILKCIVALSILIAPLIYGINTNIKLTMYVFGHLYLAVLFGGILLVTLLYKDHAGASVLRSRTLLFFGTISYSAYLFHPIIIMGYFKYRDRPEQWSSWEDAGSLALAFSTTILFCWLLRFVESKFISFGHRFKYSGAGPTTLNLVTSPSMDETDRPARVIGYRDNLGKGLDYNQ